MGENKRMLLEERVVISISSDIVEEVSARDEGDVEFCTYLLMVKCMASFASLVVILGYFFDGNPHTSTCRYERCAVGTVSALFFFATLTCFCALKLCDGGWLARRFAGRPGIQRGFLYCSSASWFCALFVFLVSAVVIGFIDEFAEHSKIHS